MFKDITDIRDIELFCSVIRYTYILRDFIYIFDIFLMILFHLYSTNLRILDTHPNDASYP